MAVGEGMAGYTRRGSIDDGLQKVQKGPQPKAGLLRTLLWSIISAMTAVLPAWGPDRRRTTGKSGTMVNHIFQYL